MYLNVNLTPAGGGADGSCLNTPKTPEILNSLISLSASSVTHSYGSQQVNVGDLLSPTSSGASPNEEKPLYQIGTPTSSYGHQMSPSGSSDPGGGTYVYTRVSGAFRGIPTTSGTPSPPVPELPSPVSTVEATKSALIKEGLKVQIKSKLLMEGREPSDLLTDSKSVKEEVSDSQDLTPQDEERRMRRRERNKIAATKCRNKKKEKTVILMTESESVEDQNLRLKTEIQRLKSEKMKLRKLLEDPNHVASCRHSCSRGTHQPLVVITSPDVPEHLLHSSSVEGVLTQSGVSEQSGSDVVATLTYCSPNVSSWDSSFSSDSPSPSYVNLSPSTISPLSLPNVSPPPLIVSSNHNLPTHTTSMSVNPYLSQTGSCTSYADEANLLTLSPSTDISVSLPSLVLPITDPMPGPSLESMGSSSCNFLSPKLTKHHSHKRHQPYSMPRTSMASQYPLDGSMASHNPELLGCRDYGYPSFTKENDLSTQGQYLYPLSNTNEYSNSSPGKPVTVTGKSRVTTTMSRCRYTPYDRANRQQISHNVCLTAQSAAESPQTVSKDESYLNVSCNPYKTDVCSNPFFPAEYI